MNPNRPRPPLGCELDRDDPLFIGLALCYLFNEGAGKRFRNLAGPFPATGNSEGTATVAGWSQITAASAPLVSMGLDSVVSTSQVSIAIRYNKRDATNRATGLFGNANSGSSDNGRCGAHGPYSDGTVYWDFGRTSAYDRVSVAGLSFEDAVWFFTAGPRGLEIWKNGVLKATAVRGAGDRVNYGTTFGIGQHAGLSADLNDYRCFHVWNRQLNAVEIERVTLDPYCMVKLPAAALLLGSSRRCGLSPAPAPPQDGDGGGGVIVPLFATSVSVDVLFLDDSGFPVTGKVAADFPACKWSGGDNTADTTITLSDLALITTAHPNNNTAGGVKEREGGRYRLDLPNNMFTAAGNKCLTFAETTNKRFVVESITVSAEWFGIKPLRTGKCQAGSTTTVVQIDAAAPATDDYFLRCVLYLPSSGVTGEEQYRLIDGYSASACTVFPALRAAPAVNAPFAILPRGMVDLELIGNTPSAGTAGSVSVDVAAYVNKTATAAFPNLTIGTVTTLTNDPTGVTTLLARLTATRANLLDNLSNLDAAISSLNNLSALCNIYGSPLLEIPDSASTTFAFTVVTRDNEGKLRDLDANPTITAANAAGTDRSGNLTAVSHPSTGRYTFTYSVSSSAVEESLRITVSGTISSEARYIEWIGAVVDYDTLTAINAIKAKTDQLLFTGAGNLKADSQVVSDKSGYSLGSVQAFSNVGTWNGNLTGSVGSVVGAVGSVTGNVGGFVASLGSQAKIDVTTAATAATPAVTVSDKTGFKLASDGLDSISTAEPTGAVSGWNFRQMLIWLVRRWKGKSKYDSNAGSIKVYKADGSTVLTTQTATNSGGVQDVGEAA